MSTNVYNLEKRKIKNLRYISIFVWTILVVISLFWNILRNSEQIIEVAKQGARESIEKDIVFRRWNSKMEGVYGKISKETPPNPYLDIPERDISTPSGTSLTLINPAYMTRQIHELQLQTEGVLGHITSLNPIRPENKADEWETKALKTFENGNKE